MVREACTSRLGLVAVPGCVRNGELVWRIHTHHMVHETRPVPLRLPAPPLPTCRFVMLTLHGIHVTAAEFSGKLPEAEAVCAHALSIVEENEAQGEKTPHLMAALLKLQSKVLKRQGVYVCVLGGGGEAKSKNKQKKRHTQTFVTIL